VRGGGGQEGGCLPYALAEYVARHDLELHEHAWAEAQVAALSDDIAYNTHDLDDGLRAGLFAAEEIAELPVVGRCFAEVDARWPALEPQRRLHEALRRVFGAFVEDLLSESRRRLAGVAPASPETVRAAGRPVVAFSDAMVDDLREVRGFLFERMYRHWRVLRMRRKATGVVSDLFAIYMETPRLLPADWSAVCAHAVSETARARIVADYIAGMTDRFALQEHRQLTDPQARV